MYKPPGHYDELGDVEIIEHDDRLHIFHLCRENRDQIAHIVSDDGLSWTLLPPAIRTGPPGSCDDDGIRTVSVTKRDSTFYMIYTAISFAEGGRVERNALARSGDLLNWEKYENNPVLEADPRWYEADFPRHPRVAWRDPKPFFENGTYYMTICAREKDGPSLRRGAVALATSSDLISWAVEKPLFAPRQFYDIECPQIYKIGSYYYLIGSVHENRSQKYWIAESVTGPYTSPPNSTLRPPSSHYASRIGRFKERDMLCCWTISLCDGPNPWGRIAIRGVNVNYIPSPLQLVQESDGSLKCAPWFEWENYRVAPPIPVSPDSAHFLTGNANSKVSKRRWKLECPSGLEILASPETFGNFMLEGRLLLKARMGGIAFHLTEDSAGYFIEFQSSHNSVNLIKHLLDRLASEREWFLYECRQDNHAPLRHLSREGIAFRLLAVNGEIELSLGGEVVLSTVSTARMRGQIGIFVESGTIEVSDLSISEMRGTEIKIGE